MLAVETAHERRQSFLVVEKGTTNRFFEKHVKSSSHCLVFHRNAKSKVIERIVSFIETTFKN